jgi:ferrous iron transport protein B
VKPKQSQTESQKIKQHSRPQLLGDVELPSGVVALVGSPNSGKTTLFNWLTGSRFKTVNYPGATVDYSIGQTHERFGSPIRVMDTPGTYSLEPKSPDEKVTFDAIFNHRDFGASTLIISIADATHLSRQLLVTKQLIEAGFRVILAVTMADLLSERHESLDTDFLSRELGIPVVMIDGRLGGGVTELIAAVRERLQTPRESMSSSAPALWHGDKVESTLQETQRLARLAIQTQSSPRPSGRPISTAAQRTRRLDRIFLHPFWGLMIFILIMGSLFTSIFWLAKPLMQAVDAGFSGLGQFILAQAPENLGVQFFVGGVLASLSAVLVFVPQIFILFIGIILLEDSGYLARSATLIDKPLSAIGLGGRSFVPLLSGYACAVPAMMAARTINSKRERWLTLFILPLMSCSARLPVYALLLSFLFHGEAAWKGGLTLAGIYFVSLLMGAIAAMIAGRFLKIKDQSFFMMELPVYRRPKVRLVLRQALARTQNYGRRAGPAIFCFALIIWVATTFPKYDLKDRSARLQASYAAQMGRMIEPVFEPMGGDWRVGVGLMSAFAAREVFVSSLAIVFQAAGGDDPGTMQETLLNKMQEAKAPNGRPLFTFASVLGLVIFFMIALQCLSTVMVAVRESGRWQFAILQLVLFNVVGYVLAVAVVQGLRAVGIA